jgi:hypothetical protein
MPTEYAFPIPLTQHPGMELRDWFAGQVLPKLAFPLRNNDDIRNAQELAKDCYRYADAMLEARKKPLP